MLRFGAGPTAVTDRLAAESVFSVNAAGRRAGNRGRHTCRVHCVSITHGRPDIAKMWAKTGAKPTALVLNSADYPRLSDKAAVGPGDTVGGEVARFNGIPLVVKAIGGDDPADTYHLPPPVVPYATTMLEAPDGLRIGYVEHPRHYPTPCPRRQPRGFSFPLTEAVNRLALPAPAVWAVGIAGSHDQKAGL